MNVYEFRTAEKEWVCANTLIEALDTYLRTTGMYFDGFGVTDDIVILPESEWANYEIEFEDDESTMTIAEYMRTADTPDIIASTCQ